MQYMKSTFAEEVERERRPGGRVRRHQGPGDALLGGRAGVVPVLSRTTGPILAAVPTPPSTPAVVTSAALPRLTAAAPQVQPRDDEGTLLVDGSEVLAAVEAFRPVAPAHRRRGVRRPERHWREPADGRPGLPRGRDHRPRPSRRRPPHCPSSPVTAPPPLPPRAAVRCSHRRSEQAPGPPPADSPAACPRPHRSSAPAAPRGAPAAPVRPTPVLAPPGRGASTGARCRNRTRRRPTGELEAADRAAALGAGPLAGAGAGSGPGAGSPSPCCSAASPSRGSREPSTGRVVLDVSPPEARGRVRLTVGGGGPGGPHALPGACTPCRSGKVEILASADGFKPALVEASVGRAATRRPRCWSRCSARPPSRASPSSPSRTTRRCGSTARW